MPFKKGVKEYTKRRSVNVRTKAELQAPTASNQREQIINLSKQLQRLQKDVKPLTNDENFTALRHLQQNFFDNTLHGVGADTLVTGVKTLLQPNSENWLWNNDVSDNLKEMKIARPLAVSVKGAITLSDPGSEPHPM